MRWEFLLVYIDNGKRERERESARAHARVLGVGAGLGKPYAKSGFRKRRNA